MADDAPSWLDEVLEDASYNTNQLPPNSRRVTNPISSNQNPHGQLSKLAQIPTRMTMEGYGSSRDRGFLASGPEPQPAWVNETDLDISDITETRGLGGLGRRDGHGTGHGLNLSPTRNYSKPDDYEHDTRCCFCLDPILCPFWIVHGSTALVGLGTAIINATLIFHNNTGVLGTLSRLYAIIFGAIIVLVEAECNYVLYYCKALKVWSIRGLFYIFVGVMTVGSDDVAKGEQMEAVCGGILGCLGMAYFVMGVCCLQHIKKKRMQVLGYHDNSKSDFDRDGYESIPDEEAGMGMGMGMEQSGRRSRDGEGGETCPMLKWCCVF
jgi:hypothetical protein